jgi:ribosomal protein S1
VTDELERLFPGHQSDARAAAWEEAKQHLHIGMPVTGTVVARRPFGAFVDIGVGFPVLLEIIEIVEPALKPSPGPPRRLLIK